MSGEYKPFKSDAKFDEIPIEFRKEAADWINKYGKSWHATDEKTGKPTTDKVALTEDVQPVAMLLWKNDNRVRGGRRTRRRRRRARTNRRR